MVESKIISVTDIYVDGRYSFIDLVLENGAQGQYTNMVEVLGTFNAGDEVKYITCELFHGKYKFKGLFKNKVMKRSKIVDIVGEVTLAKNQAFTCEIILENGDRGNVLSSNYADVLSLRVGTFIKYDKLDLVGEVSVFDGWVKDSPGYDLLKNRDINRSVALKAAIDILTIASPKGRWALPDGVDFDKAIKDVGNLTERIFNEVLNKE